MNPDLSDGLEDCPLIEGSVLARQAEEQSRQSASPRKLAAPVILVLACASAIIACSRCLGRWPQESVPPERPAPRRYAKDMWTLNGVATGCSNWAEIKIGDYTWGQSLESCGLRCVGTVGCVGFGFQNTANLDKDAEGYPKGTAVDSACYIWSGRCQKEVNTAWDDYVLSANRMEPASCDAPSSPSWAAGGRACGSVNACLNDNQPYADLDDAWAACSHLPECALVMKWPGDSYYLRRARDPRSDDGETLTYSCDENSDTRTDSSITLTTFTTVTTTSATATHLIKVTKDLGEIRVDHMKYQELIKDKGLTQEVVDEIKREIAEEYGVPVEDVHISLAQR